MLFFLVLTQPIYFPHVYLQKLISSFSASLEYFIRFSKIIFLYFGRYIENIYRYLGIKHNQLYYLYRLVRYFILQPMSQILFKFYDHFNVVFELN